MAPGGAARVRLKLFVTGGTLRARQAAARVRAVCDERLGRDYELVIVDVLDQPEAAEAARIVATPTLVREVPLPTRHIVGDLVLTDMLLAGLDLVDDAALAALDVR
jgi:circadian clock protein KaiB